MTALDQYLRGMHAIHRTGEATAETSYYGQLERLVNEIGAPMQPRVMCVLTTRNRGAGIPDGGLFLRSTAVEHAGRDALEARAPERGVVEVKGPEQDAERIARSAQVRRYLDRYGRVLVCTYREFVVVGQGADGAVVRGEGLVLAPDEATFWALCARPDDAPPGLAQQLDDYLTRVLSLDAPLSSPADLAWFLATYARTARTRLESAGELPALKTLRETLEEALGLEFEGDDGEHFFRSALVQTLWYGTFAAWTYWAEGNPGDERFTWRQAQWTLQVPMVRVLFAQLANPAALPVGLDEVLDWTDDVLDRVDRTRFFARFSSREAVTYFYEPFLAAYDPELRRQLGVWYTPPEVVTYMVSRVDAALREHLSLPLGLADDRVHVLDPCTGTGSFLVAAIERIVATLEDEHGDALVAQEAKQSAMKRIHGFELLPAPFVIAHLQIGLLMQRLGVPLDPDAGERASVYLTNALTGWMDEGQHPTLPFPEFEAERDAAERVKRADPILVVLGNPPYNGFAGVAPEEEGDLVEAYKVGLRDDWGITKNKLDDPYIRFWRVAERRIAEQSRSGIICFITNFGWLGDPSAVVMRKRLLREFDVLDIDVLNGDSRETGKVTPDGTPDPSIFAGPLNPNGIQVGTAVAMLVRTQQHTDGAQTVRHRDWWGSTKRNALASAATEPNTTPEWETLEPDEANWFRLRRWAPRDGYDEWLSVKDLSGVEPLLGLNENRAESLMDFNETALRTRMQRYLDPAVTFEQVRNEFPNLAFDWARFEPEKTRERLLRDSPFSEDRIQRMFVAPLDARWAYVDTTTKLWNEPRKDLVRAARADHVAFLLVRRRAPRALDGAAFLWSHHLFDQHAMHKDAYAIPTVIRLGDRADDAEQVTFEFEDIAGAETQASNLSEIALDYFRGLGIKDPQDDPTLAHTMLLHVLATGWSPRYLAENGDVIRHDWPRVPLPSTLDDLKASARLGARVAELLDTTRTLRGIDSRAAPHLQTVGAIARLDGSRIDPGAGHLRLSAGWGVLQLRATRQDPNFHIRIVMPGRGSLVERKRTEDEERGLTKAQLTLLGDRILDVALNDEVVWLGVPEAAWDLKVGGFQVLRKWLSYREHRILGRDLAADEARMFTSIARRLTELVLLGPELDRNYLVAAGDPDPSQTVLLDQMAEEDLLRPED